MNTESHQLQFASAQDVIPKKDSVFNLGGGSFLKCARCLIEKPTTDFYRGKYGVWKYCKICARKKCNVWRKNNPIRNEEHQTMWRKRNLKHCALWLRLWCKKNPHKIMEIRKRSRNKILSTISGKINQTMSNDIWETLHGLKNRRHWQILVGYSTKKLKRRLESQFTEGMPWNNYEKWHIDHITPLSRLYFNSAEDPTFKFAWSLKNLQPLWAFDNLSKGNKITTSAMPGKGKETNDETRN